MMQPMDPAYCRLSARVGSYGELQLLAASDCEPAPWPAAAADRDHELLTLVQAFANESGLSLSLAPAATDACFAGFQVTHCQFIQNVIKAVLISRDRFALEELADIWQELASARERSDVTGVAAARFLDGRVLLALSYLPIAPRAGQDPTTEDGITRIFDCLRKCHDAGLAHGGISDRWLNPNLQNHEVFGFGLSSIYAAWRRQQGVKAGLLRADPRYASASELMGGDADAESDVQATVRVLAAVASRSSEGPWCKRVNGPEALLDRFDMSTAEWLEPVISIGRTRVAQQLQRYAASAPERAESARGNDRKPLVFAGMTAGLLLAALVFTALAASMLAVPVLAGLLSRPASAASIECDKHFVELGLLSSTGGVCSVTSEVGRCGPGTKLDPSGRVCKPETPKAAVAPKETPPVVPPPPPAAPETQDGQAPAPRPEPLTIQFKTAGFNLNAKEESSLRAFATVCVLSGRVSLRPSLDRTQKNLERAFLTRLERFKDIMGVGVQVEPKPLVQDLKPATGSVTVSCLPQ